MGKKKDKKKGHGAEKTAAKEAKKLSKKDKKDLAAKGEDDIEAIIAEFAKEDAMKVAITVSKCGQPSPRVNMTLCPHPERPELFMFGGEFDNGSKTYLYNDLYCYNIKKQEWSQISSPNTPPPRCSHQAVMLPQGGGQMWVFGGEFASPTQSQFYHYKDLWVYHVKDQRWEQVSTKGGPTGRSGHKMVAFRKSLILFGGFHDNLRECKYYNDVYIFNLESRQWTKLEPSGVAPPPRSACHLFSQSDAGRIIMYGGYSKEQVKKDVEKGQVHTDMYILSLEDKRSTESVPLRWKWQVTKPSGDRPSARSGASSVQLSDNRALFYGGVFDKEDDEETIESEFFNDQYLLDLEKGKFYEFYLNGPKQEKQQKAETTDEEPMDTTESAGEGAVGGAEEIVHDDGVFTVRIGPSTTAASGDAISAEGGASGASAAFVPNPRINAVMTVKQNSVYMYGGLYEAGDKQVTLDDFYSLDMNTKTEWSVISKGTYDTQVWEDSDSQEEDDDEEDDDDDDEDDMSDS